MKKIAVVLIILIYSGCTSIVEKTGRLLDGSASADKIIIAYYDRASDLTVSKVQNKEGEESVIIEFSNFPMMKLRGSAPDDSGNFHLAKLEYLGGNIQGWNEYSMDILGEGTLIWGDNSSMTDSEFELKTKIEKVEISSARIHRYDTRITGNEAITALRNRRQRIDAVVEWMNSLEEPKGMTIKDFENHWKPLFFPELARERNRPEGWRQDSDIYVRAEDIRWNTGYTQRFFSEELIPVRNSGTLLRDWEEALPWLYMEYEWYRIERLVSQKIYLGWIGWKK
jgi:hypothetical protein